MSAAYTPTPWVAVDADGAFSIGTVQGIKGGTRHRIVRDLDERNAAHIVRCVNAHEDLVASLKAIASLASFAPHDDEHEAGRAFTQIMQKARAALAAAGAA